MRLIKKETTFILILHSLNLTNQIVIHERFKELQKTVVISKGIELVTPETAQMTDFFQGLSQCHGF